MEFGVALDVPRRRVSLDGAEVPECDDEGKEKEKLYRTKYDALGEFNLAVGPDVLEVLVAEDDDLALRDEQREFVAAL